MTTTNWSPEELRALKAQLLLEQLEAAGLSPEDLLLGAMVHGHVQGRLLDAEEFSPVFACAEALDVPIYLHPTPPTPAVFDAYFGGLPERVAYVLSTAAWGWHAETGMHSLRLVVNGVFGR